MASLARNIAIEGCIGSGKTTTAKLLASLFKVEYLEERSSSHPFLEAFYTDVEKYALETELAFALIHYHQLVHLDASLRCVRDFTIEKDMIFAEMNLKGSDLDLFKNQYAYLRDRLRYPTLTIILDVPLELLVHRIKLRGRSYEKDIPPEYLANLSKRYLVAHKFLWSDTCTLKVSAGDSPEEVAQKAYELVDAA